MAASVPALLRVALRRRTALVLAWALDGCGRGGAPSPAPATPRSDPPSSGAPTPAVPAMCLDDFDDLSPGPGPAPHFSSMETGGRGTPAEWGVVALPGAPSPPHVFGITQTRNTGKTYNLALRDAPRLADVDVSTLLLSHGGAIDQGGGVVFRAQGPDDYALARWNPLERNLRFYVVEGGVRRSLAEASTELDATHWHALRVVAEGSHWEAYLDEVLVLDVDAPTPREAGRVGLWTKADAATWFDDFSAGVPAD